jgi:hypothetical protein
MLTKVSDMLALVTQFPRLKVQIIDGLQTGVLQAVLSNADQTQHGTLIHAG